MSSTGKRAKISIRKSKKSVKLRMTFDPDSHTLYDVKKAYCDQEQTSVVPEKMVLYKSGKELADDGKVLRYYSITRIAVLSMTTRLVGGAASKGSSICIKTPNKMVKLRMNFDPDSRTVYDVKKAYCDEEAPHMKPENMVLYKSGIKLTDGKVLRHYDIKRLAVLSLAIRIQGGGGGGVVPSNGPGSVIIAIKSSKRIVKLRMRFDPNKHTIYDVKKVYCDQVAASIRPEKMALYNSKTELMDGKTLKYYNISRYAVLSMNIRLVGGAL